ncbi:MAG: hypothetical protein R8K54_08315 [Mariprofundaceae bacterium]
MLEYLNNEMFSILFNAALILSVFGLWILWWRQLKQRQNIEQMLAVASTQLQEATLMLNQALVQIQELQPHDGPKDVPLTITSRGKDQLEREQVKQKIKEKVHDGATVGIEEKCQSTANISQVAQMLRLQREGTAPEKIAQLLNVPLAQIKLMLMLQPSPKRRSVID